MQNTVKTRLSGGGASSLSTIRGIGAGLKPFRAAGNPFLKPGFTLAEVLITLGIIGVVASMTLPSIVNNNQNKQLEAGLKKVIQQFLRLLICIRQPMVIGQKNQILL